MWTNPSHQEVNDLRRAIKSDWCHPTQLFASNLFRPTKVEQIGCNYCHCSYAHKSAICSSKFLKITNMPPVASLQFTRLALCAGTNKNRRDSFPLLADTLYSVGDIRRQPQTSPQQFTASTSQFASTKMSQPSVQHFIAPNLQSTLQSSLRPVSRRKQVLQFRTNQHDVWTQNSKHSLISIHRKLSDLKRYHSR